MQEDLNQYGKCFPLTEAAGIIQKTNNISEKIPFIIDTTEDHKLNSFFKYKSRMVEVGKMDVQLSMKMGIHKTAEDIGDEMRFQYVSACKYGGNCVYDLGQSVPLKWRKMCSMAKYKFNQSTIFNVSRMRSRDNFSQIVKPEEDRYDEQDIPIEPKKDMTIGVMIDVEDTERIPEVLKDARQVFIDFDETFEVLVCVPE
jgi:hypothetical protein